MYKVLMFGGTDYSDWYRVRYEIKRLIDEHGTKNLLIISGGAPGADTMAELAARESDVHVAVVKALWETRHRSAGPQRNAVMVAMQPDEAVRFGGDRGSDDTSKRLAKFDIPCKAVR